MSAIQTGCLPGASQTSRRPSCLILACFDRLGARASGVRAMSTTSRPRGVTNSIVDSMRRSTAHQLAAPKTAKVIVAATAAANDAGITVREILEQVHSSQGEIEVRISVVTIAERVHGAYLRRTLPDRSGVCSSSNGL
jgi:hypothetical protein